MRCIACARRRAKVIAIPLRTAGASLERIMSVLQFIDPQETYYIIDDALFMIPRERII